VTVPKCSRPGGVDDHGSDIPDHERKILGIESDGFSMLRKIFIHRSATTVPPSPNGLFWQNVEKTSLA
jgi:hypothetical protein